LAEALWIIPPERMKARVEHRAPLLPAAMAIVERMAEIRHSRFVFPGAHEDRPMNSGAMIAVLRCLGSAVSVHGFRSSFSTWATERTAYPVVADDLRRSLDFDDEPILLPESAP
jgi:integrase